ncbi:MAG TPA: hypothetical protein DET40_24715 [Lentisphaeria bacterium]|nr:MAG: hypothetical protein A2X45_01290 [Lentisphaerae bacterium GWF2_50_93]HCE46763.1 hypothetical protein [Lentisphaeria bacterium]
MQFSVQFQYLLSQILVVPVMVTLLFLLFWSLLELGGFARESQDRRRKTGNWKRFVDGIQGLKQDEVPQAASRFFNSSDYPGFVAIFAVRGKTLFSNPVHLGKLVSELEIEATHGQSRMNLGVRLGPALGLIGTLIPMGPALLGLSAGNIQAISGNLAVAFSSTILGLFASAICYFIAIGRRHWYARDVSDIEYVCHLLYMDKDIEKEFHHEKQSV